MLSTYHFYIVSCSWWISAYPGNKCPNPHDCQGQHAVSYARKGRIFGFRKSIAAVVPFAYKKTMTAAMSRKYLELSAKVRNDLRSVNVCLATDIWTHQHTMRSYLGLTVHYLKGIFFLNKLKLCFFNYCSKGCRFKLQSSWLYSIIV